MRNGSGDADASVLFNLSGFKIGAQTVREGEWWLAIETSSTRAACRSCGVFGTGNGRRRVLVRDLPIAGTPVVLVWAKRTWRCLEELCPRGSWSETARPSPSTVTVRVPAASVAATVPGTPHAESSFRVHWESRLRRQHNQHAIAAPPRDPTARSAVHRWTMSHQPHAAMAQPARPMAA